MGAGPAWNFFASSKYFFENMLLVEMEKLQSGRNRKKVHLYIGDRPFYFRSIDAM